LVDAATSARTWARHWPWLVGLGLVVGVCALQFSQLHRALAAAHPTGDHAIFELNVRRALTFDQRLGAYSQGFYHPGPAYFYWLAPAYAAFGQSSFGLYAAALGLTLLFVLGCSAAVTRWSTNLSAALMLAPLMVVEMAYLGDFPQFDYWPPYVLFFGFALFLFLASGVFAGKPAAFAPLVVLGSFLVQTHVSYAPAVVIAGALSVAHAVREYPDFLRGRARWHLALALVAFAAIWALPVLAEFSNRPSNFARLYRTFQTSSAAAGFGSTVDALALEFTAPWQFALFRDRFIVPDAPKHTAAARGMALIQLALLVWAWRKARARGERFIEGLCVISGASLLTAAYALTRIRGTVAPHHTAWISIIGFVAWLAIVAGLWVIDPPRWAARPSLRFLLPIGAWFVSCLIWPIRIIGAVHANPEIGVLTESVAEAIRAQGPGRVKIAWNPTPRRGDGPPDALVWAMSVMLELEKSHLDFFTGPNPHLHWMLGKRRWESSDEASAELVFSIGPPAPPLELVQCVERGENYFLRYPVCVGKSTGAFR
jgi:hypothetical protein